MLESPFVMRIARAERVDFCTCCLRSVGMRRDDAELMAKLLVDTDARRAVVGERIGRALRRGTGRARARCAQSC